MVVALHFGFDVLGFDVQYSVSWVAVPMVQSRAMEEEIELNRKVYLTLQQHFNADMDVVRTKLLP